MVGLLLIGSAVATSLLVAAALRLPSLVSTLLAAYLAFVANLGLVTLALSPFREVTRGGIAVAELVLLVSALAGWWSRGRPAFPLAAARTAIRSVIFDPLTALFLVVVVLVLAYEVALGTSPPNNMDSLVYHLARAAAWAQHGGYFWIPNAPEVELNAYQPLAEQQDMFLLVATRSGALYALPQFLAGLAILVAVYGSARRLGFEVRAAACSAFLLATFSLVALEAPTAQNDLFAASFPAVAACLLLARGRLEPALAGAAAAFGVGTKLTTVLVLPVLVWLALARGRRTLVAALAGGVLGFVALGMWGLVLNEVHTGQLLGSGTAGVEYRSSPSYPRSVATAFYLMYGTMDLSVLSNHLIYVLAFAGLAAAVAAAGWALRRAGLRRALDDAARVATPFLAPLVVLSGAGVLAFVARLWGFPIRGPGGLLGPVNANLNEVYTRFVNEDYSAFGPLGIVALLAAAGLTVRAYVARRVDMRHLALASALPVFLIIVSLEASWAPFFMRYFVVPAVLTAPLLARLFQGRATTAAYLAVAALTVGLTFTHDQPKPFDNRYGYGRPWNLTQLTALDTNSDAYVANAVAAYDNLVPANACVGAALGPNEPSYLLYGPHLQHRVVYLPLVDTVNTALRAGLFYVVVTTWQQTTAATNFKAAGWRIRPLAGLWLLASDPHHAMSACRA
jgi:glycosyl transferase family 87